MLRYCGAAGGGDHRYSFDHVGADVDPFVGSPAAAGRPERVRVGEVDTVPAYDGECERMGSVLVGRPFIGPGRHHDQQGNERDEECKGDARDGQTRNGRDVHHFRHRHRGTVP